MKILFTVICSLSLGLANAGMVYKNINYTISANGHQSYSLDVNNDGTVDFILKFTYNNTEQTFLYSIVGQDNGGGSNQVDEDPESYGGEVGSGGFWTPNLVLFESNGAGFSGGQFVEGEHYIGMSFTVNGHNYNGWLRITVPGYNSLIINDCAYDNVSGNIVIDGSGVTEIQTLTAANGARLFVSNGNMHLHSGILNAGTAYLTLTDMAGRVILNQSIDDADYNVSLINLPSSNYIAAVYFNGACILAKKVCVE